MPSRSKVEALRSFASKVRCASREIIKGQKRQKGQKGIFCFAPKAPKVPLGLLGPLKTFHFSLFFTIFAKIMRAYV